MRLAINEYCRKDEDRQFFENLFRSHCSQRKSAFWEYRKNPLVPALLVQVSRYSRGSVEETHNESPTILQVMTMVSYARILATKNLQRPLIDMITTP